MGAFNVGSSTTGDGLKPCQRSWRLNDTMGHVGRAVAPGGTQLLGLRGLLQKSSTMGLGLKGRKGLKPFTASGGLKEARQCFKWAGAPGATHYQVISLGKLGNQYGSPKSETVQKPEPAPGPGGLRRWIKNWGLCIRAHGGLQKLQEPGGL
eukprot:7687200-Karenia_brevis.AAC.1